ncbi:MAG: hypothetical protein R3F12_04995 [Lysobacteraceae bacterium]
MLLRIFSRERFKVFASSKFHHYLLHASGELLLVVVGILIALQIDNWNNDRIAQDEIRELALNLSEAIDRDMRMLKPVERQIRVSMRQSELLADYLRDRPLEELDNAELFFLTRYLGYRPYGWNRAAMEQLKAASGLRQMRNRELAERISDYDALVQHLDQDYREDEASVRAMVNLVQSLVDQNYDKADLYDEIDLTDDLPDSVIEQRTRAFHDTEAYHRLAAFRKPLLSTDLAAFRQLANMSRRYAVITRPRPNIELPRLRSYAAEIQQMIDDEYRK